jgi:histidine ammonia-lyase
MANKPTNHKGKVVLDGNTLSLKQVVAVARDINVKAEISREAKEKMAASRNLVERWISKNEKAIYGINTGFGAFQDVRISPAKIKQLQFNLIVSHAAGVGDLLPAEVVRAMMLLRANTLAKGYSGVRIEVVEVLLKMLDNQICPLIPSKGSVGCSGDLAPLAHMTLVIMGRGRAYYKDNKRSVSGSVALRRSGINPISLSAKEGLALTNGSQLMTAIGVLALEDAENLTKAADIAGAMSLEALKGKSSPFLNKIQKLRHFRGQIKSAGNIRELIRKSDLIDCKDEDTKNEVQDPYSLRCIPQVHGASREAFTFVRNILETEINSATDNPLIFTEPPESHSAGNFHGQPVALAMDFLALAVSELGSISERRTACLIDKRRNRGLKPFLIEDGGLNSGMMLAQYTAAALASENKTLIHPASGDSIPTSANQEDHNSMGSIAARHAREVVRNVEYILAIELLCAAQALEFREGHVGEGTTAAYRLIRSKVPALKRDRELSLDIEQVFEMLHNGSLVNTVEKVIGRLE